MENARLDAWLPKQRIGFCVVQGESQIYRARNALGHDCKTLFILANCEFNSHLVLELQETLLFTHALIIPYASLMGIGNHIHHIAYHSVSSIVEPIVSDALACLVKLLFDDEETELVYMFLQDHFACIEDVACAEIQQLRDCDIGKKQAETIFHFFQQEE